MPYDQHRRAHTPRLWPLVLFSAPTSAAMGWIVAGLVPGLLGVVVITVAALVLGWAIIRVRIRIWKARHPLRPCGPGCLLHVSTELERRAPAQREVSRWQ